MQRRLFVYGSLHPDRAPAEIADVVRQFELLGKATVRGHLQGTGPYPGIVLDETGPAVSGNVFLIPSGPSALARLDAYEDFRPDDLPNSFFVRRETQVTLDDGSSPTCWIYVFNRPEPAHSG